MVCFSRLSLQGLGRCLAQGTGCTEACAKKKKKKSKWQPFLVTQQKVVLSKAHAVQRWQGLRPLPCPRRACLPLPATPHPPREAMLPLHCWRHGWSGGSGSVPQRLGILPAGGPLHTGLGEALRGGRVWGQWAVLLLSFRAVLGSQGRVAQASGERQREVGVAVGVAAPSPTSWSHIRGALTCAPGASSPRTALVPRFGVTVK